MIPVVDLPPLTVVNVMGKDAVRVVNNLCTAPLTRLVPGQGCETFFTDIRGKTLGHFCVYRSQVGLHLIGASGQAERVMAHIDRYVIREDVELEDVSERLQAALLPAQLAARLSKEWPQPLKTPAPLASPPQAGAPMPASPALAWQPLTDLVEDLGLDSYVLLFQVPWWTPLAEVERSLAVGSGDHMVPDRQVTRSGERSHAVLVLGTPEAMVNWRQQTPLPAADVDAAGQRFHAGRIRAGFPWFGVDLDESNLPQEASRDLAAVSFSKGCYLGQETVARLDALGQVQKKLVAWSIRRSAADSQAGELSAGTPLHADGKVVGRLTSVTSGDSDGEWIAIGFARRSHFEPGAVADWLAADGVTSLGTARVL